MADVDEDNLGYIRAWRKMRSWEWYTDVPVKVLFFHCLLCARFHPKRWKGIPLKQGQFPTGIALLAEETGLTISQVRTALKKLTMTNELTIESTSRGTIITVNSFSTYHKKEDDSSTQIDKPIDKPIANESQTNRKPIATLYKGNKDNKGNKGNKEDKRLFHDFIFLTDHEYEKLIKEFGKDYALDRIENINSYAHQIGEKKFKKKYDSHYHTILNWERKNGNGKNNRGGKQEPVKKAGSKSGEPIQRDTVITIED